jgi:hypothetical protein
LKLGAEPSTFGAAHPPPSQSDPKP